MFRRFLRILARPTIKVKFHKRVTKEKSTTKTPCLKIIEKMALKVVQPMPGSHTVTPNELCRAKYLPQFSVIENLALCYAGLDMHAELPKFDIFEVALSAYRLLVPSIDPFLCQHVKSKGTTVRQIMPKATSTNEVEKYKEPEPEPNYESYYLLLVVSNAHVLVVSSTYVEEKPSGYVMYGAVMEKGNRDGSCTICYSLMFTDRSGRTMHPWSATRRVS
ncbi:hypothetical protein KP79_PYT20845 [Mizuhopecten yessoensis]|uniref:Uncharacterized protein n=1 Tax=Mizuhopecten yessoensis TaxID=6573 RepID=A0A210PVC1_MIZYE|nr:hypothetical protein KP79_PYT20845 [Mizuhopecten yessoensis]